MPDHLTSGRLVGRAEELARLRELLARSAAGEPLVALGRAEHTRLHGPPDPDTWAMAEAAWERLNQPYRLAYASFRHAEALLAATGDRDTAAEVLRRAAEITGRLGARRLHAEVTALARRARLDLGPRPRTRRPPRRPPPSSSA